MLLYVLSKIIPADDYSAPKRPILGVSETCLKIYVPYVVKSMWTHGITISL